jgi:hypothetical protein
VGVGKGGEITQTLYAHMNKIKNFKKPNYSFPSNFKDENLISRLIFL